MTINAVNVRFKTNFPNVKTTIITQLNVFGERKYYLWIDKIEPTTVALYYQLSIYQLLKWALYVPPTFIELVQLKGIHDTIARRWNSTKNCTVNDSCCRFVQIGECFTCNIHGLIRFYHLSESFSIILESWFTHYTYCVWLLPRPFCQRA